MAASQVTSMVRWNYFADVRPSGQTPMSLVAVTRYPAHAAQFAVGQNIAWGTGSYTTPAHIVAEWMASPPHREIMLSGEYRDAGVAATPAVPAVLDARGSGATYAIEFGARRFYMGARSACPSGGARARLRRRPPTRARRPRRSRARASPSGRG